jgi:hypothetical protein
MKAQDMSGFKVVSANQPSSFDKIFMCYASGRWWAMKGGGNVSSFRHSNGWVYMTYKGDVVVRCDKLLLMI